MSFSDPGIRWELFIGMIGKPLEKIQMPNSWSCVSFQKAPLAAPLPSPLSFHPRDQVQKSLKAKRCLLWNAGIAGKSALTLTPSPPNLELGIADWRAGWKSSESMAGVPQSAWRSRPQLSFHLQGPCYQSNLLAGEMSHSHQGPGIVLQGHPCRKSWWVMSRQGPHRRCRHSRDEERRLDVTLQD